MEFPQKIQSRPMTLSGNHTDLWVRIQSRQIRILLFGWLVLAWFLKLGSCCVAQAEFGIHNSPVSGFQVLGLWASVLTMA